ncbi:RNA polymerase sigma factor [Comamonas sp. Tr-654]|nr:RNA polymerase sigma factor [Comamonas sp. Tr-654]
MMATIHAFIMPSDPQSTFIAHRRELLAWLHHRVHDMHVAQDMLQEIFLRFIEVTAAAPVQDARAYLFQMARNMLVDMARQQEARKTAAVAPEELVHIEDTAPGPDQSLAGRQRLLQLAEALQELPPLTQDIFMRVRVHEQSYQQVADALDISTSSVQKHLARALAHAMARLPLH